ncbi:hypothetical protein [Draconibacterium sediminis]|uniref:hypothetical protein n=1 Tax=Draconibacterium sediminis TaxID=1544798 RepID=UPI000696BFFA|nr:hypothetical protein [Draconibacterium sediminis]
MKNRILLVIATLLFACTTTHHEGLEGTWKLVEYESIVDGKATWTIPGNAEGEQLKSWSGEHFMFVGEFISNGTTSANYGNGTYTLNGNHYTEHITIHVSEDYVGADERLLIEFKGDTLIQINPVNVDWSYDKNNYRMEKYVRVK